jgi:hypothetical protein
MRAGWLSLLGVLLIVVVAVVRQDDDHPERGNRLWAFALML